MDANDILREKGAAGLRAVIDNTIGTSSAAKAQQPKRRFPLVAIDTVEVSDEPAWLIHRLLPARGLACVVGPPKSGKSFLTTDALFHVARGVPYAGRETLQGPVIYLTGEGQAGFKRRLVAMRRHYGVEGQGVPFYWIERVPDLGSEKTQDVQTLITELGEYIGSNSLAPPRAIVLDTLARCMGEGDENSARDMGRFVNRCGEIEQRFGCLVVAVHHMGKDATRGGRGSNALNGGADVTLTVEKLENYSKARIEEMKDGSEGSEWRFRLSEVVLERNISGSSATSSATSTCIVDLLSEPTPAQHRATHTRKPLLGVNGDLLKVIRHALNEAGAQGASATVPSLRAVTKATLKAYCKTMDWQQEGEPNRFRAAFSRALSSLRASNRIGFDQ